MPREKRGNGTDIIDAAIGSGIDAIVEHHPKFRGAEEYITKHIDKKRINKGLRRIEEYVVEKGGDWDEEKKAKFIYKNLANYIASGRAFDDSAKEVILKNSLEERAGGRRRGRDELEGEKYIDQAGEAFRDIYSLMKSGDYEARMPELAEAVTNIYNIGFLDTALDILKSKGLLDDRKYGLIKESIRERSEEEQEKFGHEMKRYLAPRKVAATIFGILGAGLVVLSGRGITGNVIGLSNGNVIGGVVGILLLVVSGILFLKE